MSAETMDLAELADYLRRDARELHKLASRGHLPGRKVGGQWRFARAEINQWLEGQLPGYTDEQLSDLEKRGDPGPVLATFLAADSVAVPLPATTRASVLKELVLLAERSWSVYDPDALLEAVRQREDEASTALPSGVALPHPRRPMPGILGESVIAFGRTAAGIPFGEPGGGLTDLFFLVACRDDRTHLTVLARLTRLLQQPGFLDELRAAATAADAHAKLVAAERDLLDD
jgi:PTS system nitrogen regulatory IIA component